MKKTAGEYDEEYSYHAFRIWEEMNGIHAEEETQDLPDGTEEHQGDDSFDAFGYPGR